VRPKDRYRNLQRPLTLRVKPFMTQSGRLTLPGLATSNGPSASHDANTALFVDNSYLGFLSLGQDGKMYRSSELVYIHRSTNRSAIVTV
jgi:hypothetical protein